MGGWSRRIQERVDLYFIGVDDESLAKCCDNEELDRFVIEAMAQTGARQFTILRALASRLKIDCSSLAGRLDRLRFGRARKNYTPTPAAPIEPKRQGNDESLSQRAIWKTVELQLNMLSKFMMDHCEVPPDICDQTRLGILTHIEILKAYEHDLNGGGADAI